VLVDKHAKPTLVICAVLIHSKGSATNPKDGEGDARFAVTTTPVSIYGFLKSRPLPPCRFKADQLGTAVCLSEQLLAPNPPPGFRLVQQSTRAALNGLGSAPPPWA
jgi:hypothetical protein